ncbi:Lactamase-B domain-containing protein [Sulfidibacter corallicola]|uniref:Metallo-beta-lactamase domain-containing protein n=1 Tax=Sulfidibacter corallicola TaxID=2818388 RepID=A0A8A4TJK7_SULCO|nr:MBL fold metallo-hydrolase [Sulfidibacter corallicola]QTD49031.1 hypothetical protein J3U87_25885 [Sulfidibacter corallicola]
MVALSVVAKALRPRCLLAWLLCLGAVHGAGPESDVPFIVVLGIAQDAGYPQAACAKACCADAWADPNRRRHAASLALVDPQSGRRWLFDATPDFKMQLRTLDRVAPPKSAPDLAGIFLTHGHIGHYSGLLHLGREVMGGRKVPVFAMPRMVRFLSGNGPWDQLVRLKDIVLQPLADGQKVELTENLSVTPFMVPHRDEYTETVGYFIEGPNRAALFIPDIDKWEKWETPIERWLAKVDVAYLDATFFAEGEIPGRNMNEIPHPFIVESMDRFAKLSPEQRGKVRFIHLNHTNPAIRPDGDARRQIERRGFAVAEERERRSL